MSQDTWPYKPFVGPLRRWRGGRRMERQLFPAGRAAVGYGEHRPRQVYDGGHGIGFYSFLAVCSGFLLWMVYMGGSVATADFLLGLVYRLVNL